jgi:uncharacterized circularly permuted ATP-grasp superfamily protein
MKPPLKTLEELYEFIRANNFPSELLISCDDYKRITVHLHPSQRVGEFWLGATLVKAKTSPPLDVSDQQLFE